MDYPILRFGAKMCMMIGSMLLALAIVLLLVGVIGSVGSLSYSSIVPFALSLLRFLEIGLIGGALLMASELIPLLIRLEHNTRQPRNE